MSTLLSLMAEDAGDGGASWESLRELAAAQLGISLPEAVTEGDPVQVRNSMTLVWLARHLPIGVACQASDIWCGLPGIGHLGVACQALTTCVWLVRHGALCSKSCSGSAMYVHACSFATLALHSELLIAPARNAPTVCSHAPVHPSMGAAQ